MTVFIILVLMLFAIWFVFYLRGKRFALRDRLQKADAIVVLAGTRGNIRFLDGKIATAVRLYREGWAPRIICSGKFSAKVNGTGEPRLISLETLREAARCGRIEEKDIKRAAATWDTRLGAGYMRRKALSMGVPSRAVLVEDESLHTRENAEYVLDLLKEHGLSHIILVTSPFHQLRAYLTFAKVFQPHGIKITNYYADTGEWRPFTWFLSKEHRKLVRGEVQRIKLYKEQGDLL
jgi:uncharacterized SAM-binding protein YcdF (DUF218 family)